MPFEFSLKSFVYLQVALFVLGLLFLMRKPRRRPGLRLRLGKSSSAPFSAKLPVTAEESRPGASRNLQVFFNYNGHTFEAYEALGLPAGASMTTVDRIFLEQKSLATPESRPFLEAAYQALNSALNSAKN